jgi:hypothetical protein
MIISLLTETVSQFNEFSERLDLDDTLRGCLRTLTSLAYRYGLTEKLLFLTAFLIYSSFLLSGSSLTTSSPV